jgi:hypothetical protein
VSGDLHLLSGSLHRLVRAKSFPVPTFSFDETMKYFSDINIPRESVEDVYKMCRGLPGNLAIVRRMLQSGTSVQRLLEEEPSRLPDFLAIEWREVNANNIADRKLLAVIAYSRSVYSVEDLARILDRDSSNVHLYLKSLGIITIDNESGEVSFVSEAHRRYVATQLNDLKEEANNILIDDLLKDKTSEAALSHLPTYYQQAGRLTELLGYLTPEYFANLIDHSQSLSPLYQKADVGLQTAEALRQNEALMRFGIQKSVLDELTRVVAWQSEIEARMRLRDFATATALAQSSVLKEDRLHLLATINRIRREDGLLPERELTEQIELLCDQIDPAALGERAIEIACDLVYTDADLAIRMVEEATKSREESDAIDWAFAKLSITALASSGSKTGIAEMAQKARSKISNPKVQEFSAAVSVLIGNSSAVDVIAQVSKLDPKNRLFFLRQWALANKNRDDTADVVNYSIDLLIRDTQYTPKTRDLREIATPLPFIPDLDRIRSLVGRFDSQKGSIEQLGTTEDYVRLQLILAHAEAKYDFTAATNRIIEVYWHISEIQDLDIKLECTAWLATSLKYIDQNNELEKKEGLYSIVEQELHTSTKELLNFTAEHLQVTRGAIRALASGRPQVAYELSFKIDS